jgi:hypothetical protein
VNPSELTVGSVLSLCPVQPGQWVAEFVSLKTDERWTAPVVAWAVVVVANPNPRTDDDLSETGLSPVVLDEDEGVPATIRDYLLVRSGVHFYGLRPAGPSDAIEVV